MSVAPESVEQPPRRFVVSFFLGVTAGISPIPSADLAFAVARRLRAKPWALGYQLTLSGGLAERYGLGIFTHRHHVVAQREFGEQGFLSVGGGLAMLQWFPAVIEAEVRAGLRLGERQRWVLGALTRLGWNVGYREFAPMPQFGLFLGVATR